MNKKTAIVADKFLCDGEEIAYDVSFTLPAIELSTADIQAMGTFSVPLVGLMEDMETSITHVGSQKAEAKFNKFGTHNFEFRWVQPAIKETGEVAYESCKAFVKIMPSSTGETGVEMGSGTEIEGTYKTISYRKIVDGEEVYYVDRFAKVFKIGGEDLYSQIANLMK